MLRKTWLLAIPLALAGAMLLSDATALAHSEYESSSPAGGEVVAEMPEVIDVFFSQEMARSGGLPEVFVVDESGEQVDLGATLDDDDRTHISIDMAPAMPDGRYTVIWHTLSDEDGEEARGAFHIYVGTGPTEASSTPGTPAAPVATVPAPGTPEPTPVASGDGDDGGIPAWALVLGVIGGVVVGGGGGLLLGRRAGRA